MKQTPVHDNHNDWLLKIIPRSAKKIIELGSSSGALAREYKKINSSVNYIGVEIDSSYADLSKRYCDEVSIVDLDLVDELFFDDHRDRDCWILGDVLEHLKDPWAVIKNIRRVIPANGAICACIPNMQHWEIQTKLAIGDIRYVDSGLLDKTHLRWFTRQTIIELFVGNGFEIQEGVPVICIEPMRDHFLPAIKELARLAGVDSDIAASDSLAVQYVVRAIPV